MEKILKKLIKFKTLSTDKKATKRALGWIKKEIKNLPLTISEFSFDGFPAILATTSKTKKPKVLLVSHIDVVEGSKKIFTPIKKKNRLYGRGVFDMNFATAAYIKLLQELGENLTQYNFGMLLTSDEELGGQNGVKAILKKGYSTQVCVIPDGGENWTIQTGAKGVLHLQIFSKGKSAHGSRTWLGKNAVNELIKFLDQVQALFPKEPCGDQEHNHNTCNIGLIQGGFSTNKIPDLARATLDIRFTAKTTSKQMLSKINKLTNYFPEIKLESISAGESYKIKTNNKYFKTFVKMLEARTGEKAKFITSHGSSDARFFAARKIPCILTRPIGAGHHTENEWIDLKSLNTFYEILKEFVVKTAR